MKILRSIVEPARQDLTWEASWKGADQGLITCWEQGRKKGVEDPGLASRARAGQLVMLPWKGGVEKEIKKKEKYGPLYYLAMWQGLRGDDLNIETDQEISVACTVTKMTVTFTSMSAKYESA